MCGSSGSSLLYLQNTLQNEYCHVVNLNSWGGCQYDRNLRIYDRNIVGSKQHFQHDNIKNRISRYLRHLPCLLHSQVGQILLLLRRTLCQSEIFFVTYELSHAKRKKLHHREADICMNCDTYSLRNCVKHV